MKVSQINMLKSLLSNLTLEMSYTFRPARHCENYVMGDSNALTARPIASAEEGVTEVHCCAAIDCVELVNTATTHCGIAARQLSMTHGQWHAVPE